MSAFDDALGVDALPPSPLYPVENFFAPQGVAPSLAGLNGPPRAAGASIDASAPPPATGAFAGANLAQLAGGALAPQQQSGIFGPNTGRFFSALGAGLSSAGQNWNKPAAAAFASGAGAALQGGQGQNQQQDARLKALHAAIAALKVGDLTSYQLALAQFHAASAPPSQSVLTASPAGASVAPSAASVANNAPATAGAGIANRAGIGLNQALAQARDAIARGAPREAVAKRLADNGFDPSGL
jgi:hypothetical protein